MNTSESKTTAVIVAAGEGKRFGSPVPKAFVVLDEKPLFMHSLETFDTHPSVSDIVLVVAQKMIEEATRISCQHGFKKKVTITAGGLNRCDSVYNGLKATDAGWVLVHDAARPFVDTDSITALLEKKRSFRCAVLGTPAVDTMRFFDGDRCNGTLDRSKLVRIQTPQLFHRISLINAIEGQVKAEDSPSDEAVYMEKAGIDVGLAWGNPANFKITTPHDFELAQAVILKRNGCL